MYRVSPAHFRKRAFVPRSTTHRNPVDVNLSAALKSSTLGHPSGHTSVDLGLVLHGAHTCGQNCAMGSENSIL